MEGRAVFVPPRLYRHPPTSASSRYRHPPTSGLPAPSTLRPSSRYSYRHPPTLRPSSSLSRYTHTPSAIHAPRRRLFLTISSSPVGPSRLLQHSFSHATLETLPHNGQCAVCSSHTANRIHTVHCTLHTLCTRPYTPIHAHTRSNTSFRATLHLLTSHPFPPSIAPLSIAHPTFVTPPGADHRPPSPTALNAGLCFELAPPNCPPTRSSARKATRPRLHGTVRRPPADRAVVHGRPSYDVEPTNHFSD